MVLSKSELEEMAAVDMNCVDIEELTELSDIEIDTSKPVAKKLESLASQTNNLYLYRHQDYKIKLTYQKSGATIDDKMSEYLRRMIEINF